jgi:hypothetical protein
LKKGLIKKRKIGKLIKSITKNKNIYLTNLRVMNNEECRILNANDFNKLKNKLNKFNLNKFKIYNKNYLKNLHLIGLKKKTNKNLILKFVYKIKRNKDKYFFGKRLKKKYSYYLSKLIKKQKFKISTIITKLKLKLLKVRKVFFLLIIQNMKNKFLTSFSILSVKGKGNCYTDELLIFLKKYMFLKYILTGGEEKNYHNVYKSNNKFL